MRTFEVTYKYVVQVDAEDDYHAGIRANEKLTDDMATNFLEEVFSGGIREIKANTEKPIQPIKAGVMITEDYFEASLGRKPKSQDELATFASRVEKGIDVSCHWETVNDEAKMEIERIEEERAIEWM